MAPAGCCCFSNNVRQLILLATACSVTLLFANICLFSMTAILHSDLDSSLRPVANLDGLHEYTIWHDRRRRELPEADVQSPGAVKTDDDGHPILLTKFTTTTTRSTTTPLATSPRLFFFSNSPTSAPMTSAASASVAEVNTSTAAFTTTPSTVRPTRNVVLEEVERTRDKLRQAEKGETITTTAQSKIDRESVGLHDDVSTYIYRSLLYAAPGIGCLLTTIPALLAVNRVGVRKLLPISLLLSGVLLIVLPFVVPFGFVGLFIVRFFLGVAFSTALPIIGAVAANWGTVKEQLTFISIQLLFLICAPVVVWPLTSLLHSNEVELRWIYVIYANISFLFALIFFIFYRDRPQYHPWVNGLELNRIVAGKVNELKTNRASSVPSDLLRSLSAWAIWVASFGFFVALGLIAEYIPTFYTCQQVFLVDYIGLYSVLPWLPLPIAFAIAGLLNLMNCSSSTVHVRVFNSIGFILSAVLLIAIPLVFHVQETTAGLGVLMVCLAPLGLSVCGFLRSTTVVGRLFAQHIVGAMAVVWALVHIALPFAVNSLVKENALREWTTTFIIVAAALVVCAIVFGIFGRGRSAGWAEASWDPLISNKMRNLSPIDVAADECGLYEMRLIGPVKA